jgi:hypothetical protein
MTHNFAISRAPARPATAAPSRMAADVAGGGEYVIVGGTHRNRALSGAPHKVNGFHQGVWIARGPSWQYASWR